MVGANETLKNGKKGSVYYRDGEKLTGYQKIDGSYYYLDDKTASW
jgi:glucan-binding YG repeat protein